MLYNLVVMCYNGYCMDKDPPSVHDLCFSLCFSDLQLPSQVLEDKGETEITFYSASNWQKQALIRHRWTSTKIQVLTRLPYNPGTYGKSDTNTDKVLGGSILV